MARSGSPRCSWPSTTDRSTPLIPAPRRLRSWKRWRKSGVLPSNDWFVGNGAATDISSFVAQNIVGSDMAIDIATVWDAGTELEDFAFSAGNPIGGITDPAGDAPAGTDQGGLISQVTGSDPFAAFANAPSGFDSSALDFNNAGGPIGTITLTIVPEPGSAALLAFAGLAFLRRRRR